MGFLFTISIDGIFRTFSFRTSVNFSDEKSKIDKKDFFATSKFSNEYFYCSSFEMTDKTKSYTTDLKELFI